jgi:hypothetical protein
MKFIKEHTFTAELIEHGSWGGNKLGKHTSSMDYFESEDGMCGCIEWDIPSLDTCESIGLTFEKRGDKRALTDYDGVMALPGEAAALLESLGIIVEEEFK